MSYSERIVSGVRSLLAARVVYAVSNAVLIVVLTRYLLEPDSFGRLQFALSVLSVIVLFGSLGLPKSTARYLTEYVERDASQVRYILRRSALFVVVLSVAVGALVAVSSGRLAALLGEPELLALLAVGSLYIPIYGLYDYLTFTFQGFNRVTWNAVIRTINGVGRLVFAVGLVLLGFGAVGALLGYVLGFALAVVVGGVVLYQRFYRRYERTERPEPGLERRILRYSVPLTATKAANVVDTKVDSILVGVLLNPVAVGVYAVARQVADVVTMPASSFGFTISPMLGEQKAQDQVAVARKLYEEALVYTLLFYVPAAAGLALIADPLVRVVFGSEYLSAGPVVQVLAAYVVIHAVNQVTSDGLDYLGRANSRAVAKVVMAVSNVGLNLVLIPAVGVVGAAAATAITYGGYTLFNVYIIHAELSIRVRHVLRKAVVVSAIAGVVVLTVLGALPYVSGVASLLGTVAIGGGVWAVLSVASGIVDLGRLIETIA
jgi:O-antigen/teichoic acid export membrane protein